MSYYGGTITVQGRNLITSLIAGQTIEITRIVVGSGTMPEDVEPIDMTDLVNPIAEATSTVPIVEDNVLSMTVQYRNDMNGGLTESFWLDEFGVYAKTEDTDEILLYYATLGDSPQPVNAYKDNRVDIRNYPITIALLVDADVQVTYTPGAFITSEEAKELITSLMEESTTEVVKETVVEKISEHDSDENAHSALITKMQSMVDAAGAAITTVTLTIPASGWKESVSVEYRYCNDVECNAVEESQLPIVIIDGSSEDTASNCALRKAAETFDGYVRFWAESIPEDDIYCTVQLIGKGGSSSSDSGSSYVLPVASATTLGGVKIGSGVNIADDGTISVTGASVTDADIATESNTEEMLDDVFGDEEDSE